MVECSSSLVHIVLVSLRYWEELKILKPRTKSIEGTYVNVCVWAALGTKKDDTKNFITQGKGMQEKLKALQYGN